MDRVQTEVAVVGAGAAGLYTAWCAARAGARVTLVSATPLAASSSYWAQGGLAAALGADDDTEHHLADTVVAGRAAVRESAARVLCEEAPAAVADLAALGVQFDVDHHGRLALSLEGGHSARRVVHAGGAATGRRIIRRLSALVAEDDGIEVLERRRVTAIICDGARVTGLRLDDGSVVTGRAIVLATGGAAALWSRTTNPPGAIGTGLLLAYEAGAQLADLELMQFHPTAVVGHNGGDGFLVSEAVRGEGALLLDAAGERFVDELAPRDEVARAVARQMRSTGANSVGLDMRAVDPALFPNVVSALRQAGIDPARELVPVAPAAHYMMGGVVTDLDGRATLAGLYAVGECSCTGLHGANRLASNSLSECFVFGARAGRAAAAESAGLPAGGGPWAEQPSQAGPPAAAEADPPIAAEADAPAGAEADPPVAAEAGISPASRAALWHHAGLERDEEGLRLLLHDEHPLVALIGCSALARRESRGAHQRRDLPDRDPELDGLHVTLTRGGEPTLRRWP